MKIIVGLGNPGMQYAKTRHNVGFEVVNLFAKKNNLKFNSRNFKSLVSETNYKGEKIILVKPLTYMNLSGEAVSAICKKFGASSEDLIIVYDDMDLDLGKIRIRANGSAGGHNGMSSIISCMKTNEIVRIRIGIGRGYDAVDFVLSRFNKKDALIINDTYNVAVNAIEDLIDNGLTYAMNHYN